ncbi:MarR family transcriptional regulator [Mycobacterium sp. CVI_P3]|uniref:MarR family transcriptional regulator n=1 Tax=Mycobacterium pinniadriaticum TaxID=2994102 RepID=A0ABT3SLT4_9MYCO|nr:MarR family transcriptional regulator [Mycobacterium pinniadriaticum]MCX2934014.1 MarR family transcriptional regulator [Mycobacterium pinniadriaticum]MCX2940489.1 MarR family transcriptional regulator [Mycobacterium pinniadriaticum]
MTSSANDDSLDSISRSMAQVVRLTSSRSLFSRQAAAAGVALTQPSYALLRGLIDGGPLSMGALARGAHMDVGMATRQVTALVDAGLVTREPDPSDARVSRVAVTRAGRRVAGRLQDARRSHLRRALSGWTPAELDQFDRLLIRFVADSIATPFDDD